jgi:DNA-directed RNA polymerase subunit A'
MLMEVQTQIISPRYGLSIISAIQDGISGNYLLTSKDFKISRREAIDLLSAVGVEDFSKLSKKDVVTGKEVFSVILPDDFDFTGYSRIHNKEPDHPDAIVKIKKGKLVSGVMDSNNLGKGSGLLLRNLHKQYGKEIIIDMIGKLNNLGTEVLFMYGFTTKLSDLDLEKKSQEQIKGLLDEAEKDVQEMIKQYQEGTLPLLSGRTLRETLELRILERLNKARNDAGRIVAEKANQESDTMTMVNSGSRGNIIQLAQMAACVGQQALRGGRIEKGFSQRTLSTFRKKDLGPAARGFIRNGFKEGLRPHEMFFMAMTGRDSLMDTALRTPKSGYLYRRLSNAMQDLKVEYDNTVRDAAKKIIQYSYGEDSMDVSKSEGGSVNVKKIIQSIMEG